MRIFLPTFTALLLATSASAQIEPEEPLPAGVVAQLNGDDIPMQAYLEYLYQRFGKRGVREMVGDILVEQEAARYGIVIDEAKVVNQADEREAGMRRGMDEKGFMENLQQNGQDYGMFRNSIEAEIRNELRLSALVMKTRIATDEKVAQLFDRKYGLNGIRMRVRHVVAMPNILRAEAVRAGTEPNAIDMQVLRADAQTRAEQARTRLAAGEDFPTVVTELSHDRVTKDRGGEIQNYNGRLYGPNFRAALDSMQTGEISPVVESGAGFHVLELLERTETRLTDVREELVNEILQSEPNFQEMASLRNSLIDKATLRIF
ncbi:MAG: peptidylprolyl isomerase [Planctomycetes bacterium]|nr:peptidylprolyl isomerase [Planctomycetota bacterium]